MQIPAPAARRRAVATESATEWDNGGPTFWTSASSETGSVRGCVGVHGTAPRYYRSVSHASILLGPQGCRVEEALRSHLQVAALIEDPREEAFQAGAFAPDQAKEFAGVEAGGFRAEKCFHAPLDVRGFPGAEAIALGDDPVVAQSVQHGVRGVLVSSARRKPTKIGPARPYEVSCSNGSGHAKGRSKQRPCDSLLDANY